MIDLRDVPGEAMVASVIVTIPMLILFSFGQRHVVEGVATQARTG